ncbi:MAG: hypothetical protein JKX95_07455 [Bacteroidia bacterium]|nr:hypothetical protein [Bacteroidia bacterium]
MFASCGQPRQTANSETPNTAQIIDTVLNSKNNVKNEFQADLSEVEIDLNMTSELNGEWLTELGELNFLRTTLEQGDKVIFYDTIRTSMTGWGIIKYNRAAKFYFTEAGSHIYEYYIGKDGFLYLTKYESRNDDMSMKAIPEGIKQLLEITWIHNDEIELIINEQNVKLKRKNITSSH